MRVLFVYPEIRTDIPGFSGYYAEGPAILSAVLKEKGHETDLLHMTRRLSDKAFADRLRERHYDVLGFSSLSTGFPEVRRLVPIAKQIRPVPILYGGVHPTLDPEGSLAVDGVDMVCVGEGEYALLEVVDRLQQGAPVQGILNIWSKQDGRVQRNACRGLVEDLDSLPLPDYSLFSLADLFSAREGVATATASRGCPFQCSYCSNHKVKTLYPNKEHYVRFKSVNRVIQEARVLVESYSRFKYFDFSDDIFMLKKDWLEEFSGRFPVEVGMPFVCNALVNLLDEERVSLLRKAGCTMVTIGLESGSERLRQGILKRPAMTNQSILAAGRLLAEHGIKLATYNMIGLPTETLEDVFETLKLNASLQPTKINEFIFQPYPNTELFDRCVELGFYDGKEALPNNWRKTTVVSQGQLPPHQVLFLHRYFKLLARLLAFSQRNLPGAEERILGCVQRQILPRKWLTQLGSALHGGAFSALKILYVILLRRIFNRRGKEFSQEAIGENRRM